MRWLFILLLLVNTLYFGWQMRQHAPDAVESLPASVTRIRLLDEVERSLLLPRSEKTESSSAESSSLSEPLVDQSDSEISSSEEVVTEPPESWCQVLSGITDAAVADELQERLELQGVISYVVPIGVEEVLAYELILNMPESGAGQQGLIDNLTALGFSAEEGRVNSKAVYIIGRYGSRAALNQARDALIGLFEPALYQVVSQESQFELWVESDASVKTGNKIKELDQFFSSSIKIEKKLCKGVASMGARD